MASSEDEAYEPWPNCIMDRTGCHGKSYYHRKYTVSDKLAIFFKIDKNAELSFSELDDIVIEYAEANNGITRQLIHYDEDLWNLLGFQKDIVFKFYQIEKYMREYVKEAPASATCNCICCASS